VFKFPSFLMRPAACAVALAVTEKGIESVDLTRLALARFVASGIVAYINNLTCNGE
jgi:hypothetical protein